MTAFWRACSSAQAYVQQMRMFRFAAKQPYAAAWQGWCQYMIAS